MLNYKEKMTKYYDFLLGQKGYWRGKKIKTLNYGYWEKGIKNDKNSNKLLVHKILDLLPDINTSKILDVACGEGYTTSIIGDYFKNKDVVGINISKTQIENARIIYPDYQFLEMDSTNLKFEDNSFDLIVCVEAAFHFKTREKFIQEAFRVLKPSGYLIMTDIFFKSTIILDKDIFPLENIIIEDSHYKKLFLDAGFSKPHLKDVTRFTFKPFRKRIILAYFKSFFLLFYSPKEWFITSFSLFYAVISRSINLKKYITVSVSKPA